MDKMDVIWMDTVLWSIIHTVLYPNTDPLLPTPKYNAPRERTKAV